MNRARIVLAVAFLLFAAAVTINCGSNSNRMLQSISISPTSVTAQHGHAQFVATGTFTASPVTVTPLSVNWSGPALPLSPVACTPNRCPGIDNQGLASCGQTWTGTVTITASAPRDPNLPLYTQNVPMVSAAATLICP